MIGKPITYIEIDDLTARQGMAQVGIPEWNIRLMEGLNRRIKLGMTAGVSPPGSGRLPGRPPTTFGQFARDHVDAWK